MFLGWKKNNEEKLKHQRMVETNNKEFNILHCVDFLQDRCEKHMHFIVCHVACVFKCFVNQFFIEFSICLFFV